MCTQKVTLADLKKIKVLGQGAFGQVVLVKHGNQHYALKILSKQQIITQGLQVCPTTYAMQAPP